MLERAWRAYCDRECITESTDISKDQWVRGILFRHFKVTSTTLLNKKDQFEKVMAIFEEIADEDPYWQEKAIKGDAKRARYLLDQTIANLRLTEDYVAGIQRQMQLLKPLNYCNAKELLKFRVALLYHCRRRQDDFVDSQFKPKGSSAPPA